MSSRVHLTTSTQTSGETLRGFLAASEVLKIRALLNRGSISSVSVLQLTAEADDAALILSLHRTLGDRRDLLGRWRIDGAAIIPDLDLEAATL